MTFVVETSGDLWWAAFVGTVILALTVAYGLRGWVSDVFAGIRHFPTFKLFLFVALRLMAHSSLVLVRTKTMKRLSKQLSVSVIPSA